jgi:hypothetical protein
MVPPNGYINPELLAILERLQYSNPGARGQELMGLIRNEMMAREPGPMDRSTPPLIPSDIDYESLSNSQLAEYQRQGYDVTPELYAPGSTATRYDRSDFLQSDFYDELARKQSQPGGDPIVNTGTSDFDLPDNKWDRRQARESGVNSGFNVTRQYTDENPDFSGVFRNNKWDRQQRRQSGFSSDPIITSGSDVSSGFTYRDITELNAARDQGTIDEDTYWKEVNRLYDPSNERKDMYPGSTEHGQAQNKKETNVYDSEDANEVTQERRGFNPYALMMMTPDLNPSQLSYYIGSLAASNPDSKKGKFMKGLGIGAAGFGTAVDLARTGLSGFANKKLWDETEAYRQKKMIEAQREDYTPAPQYYDYNNRGEFSFEEGGEMGDNNYQSLKKYFSGGFADIGDRALQLLGRFQGNGGGDTTEGGQTLEPNPNANNLPGNPTDLTAKTMGTYSPNPNMENLMRNDNMNNMRNDNMNNANALNKSFLEDTRSGYNVGQPVTFEYGGKMVSGTIKKIEGGKIYI